MSYEPVLIMQNIDKSFFGVQVLKNVNFSINKGEIHGLIGENGAGKSTLMKILNGIYTADSGSIILNGKHIHPTCPLDALQEGLSIIHQELSLVPEMSIADNFYLGIEICKKPFGNLDRKAMNQRVQEILDILDISAPPQTLIRELSIATQQMIEIGRALFFGSKIIVMDEPTSSLTDKEVKILFEQMRKLKRNGTSIVFITHRMYELPIITDRITVLRDGCIIGTAPTKDLTDEQIIEMMVGRSVENTFGEKVPLDNEAPVVFEARGISNDFIQNVSFSLKKGEILGFAGLVGAGRTELMRAIFGMDKKTAGEIFIDGNQIEIRTPKDAIKNHLGLVPEDRKKQGLILFSTVEKNLTLLVLDQFIHGLKVDKKKEKEIIDKYAHVLNIKMSGPDQFVYKLSGGNQQKVVLSKWLANSPKILILDEPTRGIDVGSKAEIYQLIKDLAKEKIAVLLVSSDLTEIVNLSHRIAVMHEGKLVKVLDNLESHENLQQAVMYYATGGQENESA